MLVRTGYNFDVTHMRMAGHANEPGLYREFLFLDHAAAAENPLRLASQTGFLVSLSLCLSVHLFLLDSRMVQSVVDMILVRST